MANRQLKIWRDDLRRYYDKTSLMMRVVIGAVLSFIFAYYVINKVVKPQNAQNAKLKQKLEGMEIIEDVDSRVVDLKNDTRKANLRLEAIEKVNAEVSATAGSLLRSDIGQVVLELRSLIDKHELRITQELKRQVKTNKIYRRRNTRVKANPRVAISFPSAMAYETQYFSVLGSYDQLRQFLMDIHHSPRVMFVDNIKINESNELLTDRDLNQYRALSCEFEIHVPYLKAEPAVADKGGAKK